MISKWYVHQWRVHEDFLPGDVADIFDSIHLEFGHVNKKAGELMVFMHTNTFKSVCQYIGSRLNKS